MRILIWYQRTLLTASVALTFGLSLVALLSTAAPSGGPPPCQKIATISIIDDGQETHG